MQNTAPKVDLQPIVTTSVEIPRALWLQFRSKAVGGGTTAKAALIEAIEQWVHAQADGSNRIKTEP